MQATTILMNEHRLIERVLNAIQAAADRLELGAELRPAFFTNAALFIRNYADGCHHHKEEGVLFLALQEAGMPNRGGPLGIMLAEHEEGRAFTREMKAAATLWEQGDLAAHQAVLHNARGYVALLRQHIQKEDNILFPMADRLLPPERQEKVNAEFDRIGAEEAAAGLHEKYLALAEVLEKESAGRVPHEDR